MGPACIQMPMSRQLEPLCVMIPRLHFQHHTGRRVCTQQSRCTADLVSSSPLFVKCYRNSYLTPLTWYWYNWRISGQEMKWLRCIAITNVPLCGEFISAATAWRSRAVIPVTCAFPWRMRASSCPRACCSARASGRRFEFCHRGSGFSGKS